MLGLHDSLNNVANSEFLSNRSGGLIASRAKDSVVIIAAVEIKNMSSLQTIEKNDESQLSMERL